MPLENAYQAKLIKKLRKLFPGCVILKNDSAYMQGVPDLTVLYQNWWFVLEVKASASEPFQPNQEWYLDQLNQMSFAAAIYPENEKEVLDAVQQSFEARRRPRVSKR